MPISMVPNVGGPSLPKPPVQTPVNAGGQAGQPSANMAPSNMPSTTFQAAELIPSGAQSAGPLAEIVSNALSNTHTKIDNLAQQMPNKGQSAGKDEVGAAMRDMSPSNADISAAGEAGGNAQQDSLSALNKTFDHAIFMAMVNQVISGVGDTSRTLIRQS